MVLARGVTQGCCRSLYLVPFEQDCVGGQQASQQEAAAAAGTNQYKSVALVAHSVV